MSAIIRTTVSNKAEQFTLDGVHYVGRRVQFVFREYSYDTVSAALAVATRKTHVLFRLDYSKGDIFVDPALLRPFPDGPIEEPSK